MTLPEIKCVCCGHSEVEIIHRGLHSVYSSKPFDVVRCIHCENGITAPAIRADELQHIYSSTYLYPVHLLALKEKKFRAHGLATFLATLLPADSNKKILEIGCMFGYLLEELKDKYVVSGIDIGKDAVTYCRNKGLHVALASAEEFIESNKEKFDTIILSHVLEHLLEPGKVLEQLKNFLTPHGTIIVLVPNRKSINARLFGRFWGWWQVPVHINHFSLPSLIALASRHQLSITAHRFRGGDSLMLLLNFINLFQVKNKNQAPGFFQKLIISFFTFFLKYWYWTGNEELTVVMQDQTAQ